MSVWNLRILILTALGLLLLAVFSSHVIPLTVDSLVYITTAEHISRGQGLFSANFFAEVPSVNMIPTLLEPPGYPLLMAALKIVGINAYTAALVITRLCFLFLPFLFFMLFQRLMSKAAALVIAFVCTFSFAVVKCSLMAWADVPYLCFSLITLNSVLWLVETNFACSLMTVFFLGVIGGYALLIKYVGVSLLTSIALSVVLCGLLRIISFSKLIKPAIVYVAGAALVIVPYVIRNMMVFGTYQPFHMPPASISLGANIGDYLRGISQIIVIEPSWGMEIGVFLSSAVLAFLYYAKSWKKKEPRAFVCGLFLLNYFLFNSLFLLVCRAHNLITEINDRYVIQLAWLVLAMLGFGLYTLLKGRRIGYVTVFVLIAFIGMQSFPAIAFYFEQKRIKKIANTIEQHEGIVYKIPSNYVLVSNIADITYSLFRRNVRMLGGYTPRDLTKFFSTRPVAVFLVKEGKFISPFWSYQPIWEESNGYRKIFSDDDVDLLVYP